MREPVILVPAAGDSRRYKDAGIQMPKSLIKFGLADTQQYTTMLEHCLHGLPKYETYVIAKESDAEIFEQQIGRDVTVVPLPLGMNQVGQSITIWCGLNEILRGDVSDVPVVIVNSDNSFRYPLATFVKQARSFTAAALVMPGHDSTAYSYVDGFPRFGSAKEKEAASPWAMAGAYYFNSARQLGGAIDQQIKRRHEHAGEFYLSGVFEHIGGECLAVAMQENQLVSWGTPEDLARDPFVRSLDAGTRKLLEELK